MANIEMNLRTLDGTHIDSKVSKCDLNIPRDWELDLNWYRFYGNNPKELEYRITASSIMEVNLDGMWTPIKWTYSLGAAPARIVFDYLRADEGWTECYLHLVNDKLHEVTLHPYYGTKGGWASLAFAENNAIATKTMEIHLQRKADEFPVIPPMSEERRIGLLEKARIGFEDVWELYYHKRRNAFAADVAKWAGRMMNLGYHMDPREDPHYATERSEPASSELPKTEFFWHNDVPFIGNKEEIDKNHSHDVFNCECYACDHDQTRYENGNTCCCDQCCNNDRHWDENGRDPEHCDLCAELYLHYSRRAPDYLRKEED